MGELLTLDRRGQSLRSPFEIGDEYQQPPGGKWEYYNHSSTAWKWGSIVSTTGKTLIFSEVPRDTICVYVGFLYYPTSYATYITGNPYGLEGASSSKYWFISYCVASEQWIHPAYLFLGSNRETTIYAKSGSPTIYISYPHFFIRG